MQPWRSPECTGLTLRAKMGATAGEPPDHFALLCAAISNSDRHPCSLLGASSGSASVAFRDRPKPLRRGPGCCSEGSLRACESEGRCASGLHASRREPGSRLHSTSCLPREGCLQRACSCIRARMGGAAAAGGGGGPAAGGGRRLLPLPCAQQCKGTCLAGAGLGLLQLQAAHNSWPEKSRPACA